MSSRLLRLATGAVLLGSSLSFVACEGDTGPAGANGQDGQDGAPGEDGAPGGDGGPQRVADSMAAWL